MQRPVALITMATSYVGPALARKLASQGFDLVLHGSAGDSSDTSTDSSHAADVAFDDLVPELQDLGAGVLTVTDADLTTAEGNRAVVGAALHQFGRLDSACFTTGSIVVGKFLEMTGEHWERVKRANLDMVFHALQATIPAMTAKSGIPAFSTSQARISGGQIVIFTSATGARPEPMVSLYGATRAGANALVRAVGLEYAHEGISINAIGTNYMDFPGFLAATGADDPDRRATIEDQVPLKRLGTMEELAEFAAVLLNGKNRFQTGQFFSFSGGWST